MVPCDTAETIAKGGNLRVEHAGAPQQAMRKQQHRLVAAGVFYPQAGAIDGDMGHVRTGIGGEDLREQTRQRARREN